MNRRTKIEDLDVSVRCANAFVGAGIPTVGVLLKRTRRDLLTGLRTTNVRRVVLEIRELLLENNYLLKEDTAADVLEDVRKRNFPRPPLVDGDRCPTCGARRT